MKTFADRLRYAMAESGMRACELSQKSGISKPSISQYLSNRCKPKAGYVKLLAQATGVSVDFLMGDEEAVELQGPIPKRAISLHTAAQCLWMSPGCLKQGLIHQRVPVGYAIPGKNNHWRYIINPFKLKKEVGAERFNAFFGLAEEPEEEEARTQRRDER